MESGEPKETTQGISVRTQLRERIRKLNKKAKNSPEKFPEMKQAMVSKYFVRKSPKANKAREKLETEPETNINSNFKGASNSPHLGDTSQPRPPQKNTQGPGPEPELRGGARGNEDRKRISKVLERWPLDPGSSSGGPKKSR